MWYECLPSAAIIGVMMCIPQYAAWYTNKIMFGNPFRRDLSNDYALKMFNRDCRVQGAPWTVRGLENIPDEE